MNSPSMSDGAPVVLWRWRGGEPGALARARTVLAHALSGLGYDGEAVSDAVLAVSELVANAVEHAVGPYELRLHRTASDVICEVVDHDPRIPEIPPFGVGALLLPVEEGQSGGPGALCALLSERGRGLPIVHELARGAWGLRRSRVSKAAWIALPLPVDGEGRSGE
ncbi:ATP-binding protein [Streptomyces coffeae]|uniref:ATP-binding protein n=1 Tax=Streptomyces coffeae TaxID=621382 RepID=A0ABS1N6I6_9ACTN|nr:ATP-binding protein [Streptomyces coffeae]MBL1095686.1 ATP-binding protein [Streptomyces coffeae]